MSLSTLAEDTLGKQTMGAKEGKDNYLVLGGIYGDLRGLDFGLPTNTQRNHLMEGCSKNSLLGHFSPLFVWLTCAIPVFSVWSKDLEVNLISPLPSAISQQCS